MSITKLSPNWSYQMGPIYFLEMFPVCDICMGPSIRYVTLFMANFYPPIPCHTSSHIPGPPESTSHISDPPIFRRPRTKIPDKSHLVQILSQLFAGVFVRGLSGGSFVWKVLSGVVFVHSRSVRIHLLHQKLKHHFKFHVSYV